MMFPEKILTQGYLYAKGNKQTVQSRSKTDQNLKWERALETTEAIGSPGRGCGWTLGQGLKHATLSPSQPAHHPPSSRPPTPAHTSTPHPAPVWFPAYSRHSTDTPPAHSSPCPLSKRIALSIRDPTSLTTASTLDCLQHC